jgi:hypothetical protein
MTGTSCAFLLTKSLNLPLYYFPFFSICTTMLLYIVDTAKHLVMFVSSELVEWRFLKFCFKEVMFLSLAHFYVVMLPDYSLVLIVIVLVLIML